MNTRAFVSLRTEQHRTAEDAPKRERLRLIVVDRACHVLFDSIHATEHEWRLLLSDDRKSLRGNLAVVVRSLVDQCVSSRECDSEITPFDANHFVRVTRLDGHGESLFAVTLEFFRGGDSLSRAARKYRLTPREIDVLAMILEGASAIEIAQTLQIAETTVQGYYKRLLSKTQSRNRPAMVANVLDWDGSGRPRMILGEV